MKNIFKGLSVLQLITGVFSCGVVRLRSRFRLGLE